MYKTAYLHKLNEKKHWYEKSSLNNFKVAMQ